jgi:predicted lipid-binding transport protein (Tim44 family)
MGLVKKLLDGILAFVGGIFGFLGGLLGFKKSEYYMEMAEEKEKSTVSPAATQLSAQSAAPETAQPSPAKAQSGHTKSAQVAASVQPKAPAPKPAAQAVATAQPPKEVNFATKYFVPSDKNSRRRPGPSMNYFLDMAKQVKS